MNNKLKWISNIAIGLLIIIIILSIIGNIKNAKSNNKINYILKYIPMNVLTGSMEPYIKPGDMIISKKINSENIVKGDVVTYKTNNKNLVTHRVMEIIKDGNTIFFKTKGDANNIADEKLVTEEDIVGKLVLRIPKVGYVGDIIRTPLGFITCIVIPIILLIIMEIKTTSNMNKAVKKE